MSGTTLCPRCNTRFKIAAEQLEAHHGMVRCGHCLQAFDARPCYVPDQPHPQLELPMPNESVEPVMESATEGPASSIEEAVTQAESPAIPHGDLRDFHRPAAEPAGEALHATASLAAPTLAGQVAIVQDGEEEGELTPPAPRRWPWAIAAFLSLLLLSAQAAYFFRIELAARLPALKPALIGYCRLLGCSVPLPQNAGLMSIDSSDLEADPEHVNQINLSALLRNHAPYAQAFPDLELTLNDIQDRPLARRIFKPKDYLPPQESEQTGLLPNRELSVRLYLDTNDLRPAGYRLVLLYP